MAIMQRKRVQENEFYEEQALDLERQNKVLEGKVAEAQRKVDQVAQENGTLRAELEAVKRELSTSQAALILRIK